MGREMEQENDWESEDEHVSDVENDGVASFGGKGVDRYWSEVSERNMSCREPLIKRRMNTTSQIAIVGVNVSPIESLDYE